MHAKHYLRAKAIRWAITRATRVIAVSDQLREFAIRSGALVNNVSVIPNGIDTGVFYPHTDSGIRLKLGIPRHSKIVLSVGFLIERKGHHRTMMAVSALRKQGVDVHLLIIGSAGGEGNFEPELHRLRGELRAAEFIHFLGELAPADVANVMSQCSVLCLASTREGWPNVVNEALACGTPVVASSVGGAVEMLRNPDHGVLVPDLAGDGLSIALARALERSWDRIQIAACGSSRSWQQVASECLAVLHAATGENR